MERFFIYAKPNIREASRSSIAIYSDSNPLSSENNLNISLVGKYFFDIRNLYVTNLNGNLFDNEVFFNPFSAIPNLYPSNPGFHAIVVPEFTLYNDQFLSFTLPQTPKTNGFFDVILENEAGYNKLTIGSIRNYVSSWSGFVNQSLPTVSGIQVEIIV